MKISSLEEIALLEKNTNAEIKKRTKYALNSEIIQNDYDLLTASLAFSIYLPRMVNYSIKNLKTKKAYMYLKSNNYISKASISEVLDESRKGFIGEYSKNNFLYLLNSAKNIGSVTFEYDNNTDKALTKSYKLIDLLLSKAISHFLQAKNPSVELKNRIFRGMGMNIYETSDSVPNIAPNTKFGYDLKSFTFMPGSIFGEEGGMFDHVAHYKKISQIIPDNNWNDYLSKSKSLIWTMTK